MPALPANVQSTSSSTDSASYLTDTAAAVTAIETVIPDIAIEVTGLISIPPIPIKLLIETVIVVIGFIGHLLGNREKQDSSQSDDGRMAAYYKWRNELRDQETQVKANYTASIEDFLQKHFDVFLAELDRQLSQTNDTCREHAEYVRKVEQLLIRASEEIAELSLAL